MVKFLVFHGADVNVKDNDGRTPLYWVKTENHNEIADFLLSHGAVSNE
ncbi:ankyrin repeat protein, putative [Trichomonas vaginalis G3]|uniref:Ankyrin repeat protein, putative n=1 Tax=Trichomonas vaginalis (strain ATCC PRA-98 / G3) TaxID=412133 RepID=A2DCJ8_TRIV3|nr:Ankyrin repeat family [Trichomonas vaginalis G3]EAY21935.1 ankyrin repeat protein, putative [Trichomonas vaginalis G3]KAI5487590.1 Ankyrin repeat family [Trichomonas vaginalis G3]|eukprot:XP_001582921.1 ankyrin repeat protein [Trichomonas vaginalis G3]